MPFDTATSFVETYLQSRQEALLGNKPMKWATDGKKTFKAVVDDLFDGDTENDKWATLQRTAATATSNNMIGIRNKIGWLAACNRDMRTQYASTADCRQRSALDHTRYHIIKLKWALNGFRRFVELVKGRLAGSK